MKKNAYPITEFKSITNVKLEQTKFNMQNKINIIHVATNITPINKQGYIKQSILSCEYSRT